MIEIAMFLIATAIICVVVPNDDRQIISIGRTANVFQIIRAERIGTVGLMQRATVLSDVAGNILVDIFRLELAEDVSHMILIGSRVILSGSSRMAPLCLSTVVRRQRETARIIEVNTHHDTVSRISGQRQMIHSQRRIGRIAADTNPTGGIVASGCSNGIHRGLVPCVERIILLAAIGAIRSPSHWPS